MTVTQADSQPTAADSSGQSSVADNNDKSLPALTPAEFRTFNSLAERMDVFHNRFRQSWTILYDACLHSRLPESLNLTQFLRIGTDLCHHLELHHQVEEEHIFPYLATRMPGFGKDVELVKHHRAIHGGVERLEAYLKACGEGEERNLRLDELKEIMDGFGDVLWMHLDVEVRQLGAENIRRYWTLEEVKDMPFS